jgi:EmrB/QacA subfamily drug resistance transporter
MGNQNWEAAETEKLPGRKEWITLLILAASLMIVVIDVTIINVTLPSIQAEFNATLQDLEWITAIYALVFAAFMITWGRIGDDIGRRKILIAGVAIFVLGSAITGFSTGIPMMLIGRAIQGFGAAMASPSTLSILTTTFRGSMRGIAFGIWGATAAAAGALGPLVGGFLTTYATWRWAFLINLPIGIIVVVGALAIINETTDTSHVHRRDNIGVILSAAGLALLVFGLIEGQNYGWIHPKQAFRVGNFEWPSNNVAITSVAIFLAVVFLITFVLYELNLKKRGGEPLFDFTLLKHLGFRYGLLTVAIVALGEFGILFIFSIYLQTVRGLNAFQTGLLFLPFAVANFIAAPIAGTLSSRFGPKWVVTAGMLIEASAIFTLTRILSTDTSFLAFIPAFLLYGTGVGFAIAQVTNVTLSDVPPQKVGAASGANNTVRQVGAAIGIAILGAVLAYQIASTAKNEIQANPAVPESIKTQLTQAFDNGLSANTEQYSSSQTDSPIGQAIKGIFDDAVTQGTRSAGTVAAVFVLLGALSSLLIPNVNQQVEWHGETPETPPFGE